MDKDPYLSNWENTIEAARKQENEMLSIEYHYPPDKEKAMNRERVMPADQQVAIIKAYSQVSLFAKWNGPGKEEAAIEAKDALEKAFPWLLDDAEDYMEKNY